MRGLARGERPRDGDRGRAAIGLERRRRGFRRARDIRALPRPVHARYRQRPNDERGHPQHA
ncbi:MAG: hypothetical protein E6H84_01130 [Chloroflexi bacterium]|nr:MAG: hypothetical protein E6H84_01130 [Chloroflexota bacterium]TMG71338.1 MAG: hypothetical protein E6H81_04225 [Chloroflexota bacterium]